VKRVLIVTYYWPPGGGSGVQRWLKFSRYLPEFGWEPVIFTVDNPQYQLSDQSLEQETLPGIEVHRLKAFDPNDLYNKWFGKSIGKPNVGFTSSKKESAAFRLVKWIRGNWFIPDSRIFWVRPASKRIKQLLTEKKFDAIITTGPPHSLHLIGKKVATSSGIRWIADFRDPWTEIYYFNEMKPSERSRQKHLRLEKMVLQSAQDIVVVGETMKKMFSQHTQVPIHVITNGYDHEDYLNQQKPHSYNKNTFVLSHIGVLSPTQNPYSLWKALQELVIEESGFKESFILKLTGEVDHGILKSVKEMGLDSYLVHTTYQPHKKAIDAQIEADILLLSINKVVNSEYLLTGKLFEYLGAERPILCIGPPKGDAAEIISQTASGQTFDFEDVAGIKDFIKRMFHVHQTAEIHPESREISRFSRKSLTKRLVDILNG
jgi:Glycosyltransferase Family 4